MESAGPSFLSRSDLDLWVEGLEKLAPPTRPSPPPVSIPDQRALLIFKVGIGRPGGIMSQKLLC